MQKPTQIFTPDALFSFQNAQLVSQLAGESTSPILIPESIFWGSYGFIRESDQFQTFSTML
ncbi:MAG: hypothetical protein LBD11_00460 [Candidatus Peribacteria bacterium]|jgi:hypothetical protein|nr:hypothetical protein [Candidatus Peribacteria bacterium]